MRRKELNSELIAKSTIGKLFVKILSLAMESRFRYRFFGPMNILRGADNLPGHIVLEIGCGTGFFTVPAAKLIGGQGSLVSIDVLPESVELVSKKVQAANLKNVRVVKADALGTALDTESFHTVLLFGVIPSPMLPLNRLLPEMHRVLIPGGTLAVWPLLPSWLPKTIIQSGLFKYSSKRNGVCNFTRC
jgi:ubiquinone/menaquinone biosynthesis C-methylase UbiE